MAEDTPSKTPQWRFKASAFAPAIRALRMRYAKDMADASTVVQNSTTILYRIRPDASLPLAYISPNITKFGYAPSDLLEAPNWTTLLMATEDSTRFANAMRDAVQEPGTEGAIEFRFRTSDGTYLWAENRYTPVRDASGNIVEIEGIIIDITARKLAEEKLAALARTDGLTRIANRTTFIERLRQAFAASRRGANAFAVICIDIDHFKHINDTYGHPTGDLLLQEFAERLRTNTRDSDVIGRLGGDEFAVLQSDMCDPERAGELAEKLLHALECPYHLDGSDIHITASIGIAPYTSTATHAGALLCQADLALYRAKEQGRNQYRFHSVELDDEVRRRVAVAAQLRKAIDNQELTLFFQPQVDVISGNFTGLEALAFWSHPTRGLLSADAFLAIAEHTGLIAGIGRWTLHRTCKQLAEWRALGIAPPAVTIDLSLAQLKNPRGFFHDVRNALSVAAIPASCLAFGITEATLAQLTWTRNDILAQLHRLGAKIAVSDFGNGYSSFDNLQCHNVSHLKIGRSLIAQAANEPKRAEILRAMVCLAQKLGLAVTAQGLEIEDQRRFLELIGASTKAPASYFSGPVDACSATRLLRQNVAAPRADSSNAADAPRRMATPA